MIGLHKELEARELTGKPVRIGMIGAGQMGTDVVAEVKMMKGIDVVITADIDLERAIQAYQIAQVEGEIVVVETAEEADRVIASGKRAATRDYRVVADMKNIDVMLEATGAPEIGTQGSTSGSPRRSRPGDDERRD